MIVSIVGWVLLIGSWVAPRFVKDDQDKSLLSLVLSALAVGIFVGSLLQKYCM